MSGTTEYPHFETAAFIGNDVSDPTDSVLVAFAGQLPVLVPGIVHEGDLVVAAGDGTGRAVRKARALQMSDGMATMPGIL